MAQLIESVSHVKIWEMRILGEEMSSAKALR